MTSTFSRSMVKQRKALTLLIESQQYSSCLTPVNFKGTRVYRRCARAAACEKMAAFSRRKKVLIVVLVISVCVLLYFWLRVTSLKSEADGARLLVDDAVREQDRMKLNVSEGCSHRVTRT